MWNIISSKCQLLTNPVRKINSVRYYAAAPKKFVSKMSNSKTRAFKASSSKTAESVTSNSKMTESKTSKLKTSESKKSGNEYSGTWEAGINEVTILGTLGKDPWLATVDGKQILHLLVAVPNYAPFSKGTRTNWCVVCAQDKTMIKSLQLHVKEGMRVYFQGRLSCVENSDERLSSMVINKYFCL